MPQAGVGATRGLHLALGGRVERRFAGELTVAPPLRSLMRDMRPRIDSLRPVVEKASSEPTSLWYWYPRLHLEVYLRLTRR